MTDLEFLGIYSCCYKNLVCHARSQSGSKFCNNTSASCKKAVCPFSRNLEKSGTEQEFHRTGKSSTLGGRSCLVLHKVFRRHEE